MTEEATPITLTEKAAARVLAIRAEKKIAPEKVLRLAVRGGGCAGFTYQFYFDDFDDFDAETDRKIVLQGVTLVVDEMSLMYLEGTEIDYQDGLNESGFKFNNPRATGSCGCGSSFSA